MSCMIFLDYVIFNCLNSWKGQDKTNVAIWWLIRSCIHAFHWCQNQRPWMTLNSHCGYKRVTFSLDCGAYSLYEQLHRWQSPDDQSWSLSIPYIKRCTAGHLLESPKSVNKRWQITSEDYDNHKKISYRIETVRQGLPVFTFYRAMHVVLARYCYRNLSVRSSVRLSVRP